MNENKNIKRKNRILKQHFNFNLISNFEFEKLFVHFKYGFVIFIISYHIIWQQYLFESPSIIIYFILFYLFVLRGKESINLHYFETEII